MPGTVIEEGGIDIEASKLPDDSRIHNIIELIENSEELKSVFRQKPKALRTALCRSVFLISIAAYAVTGNVTKALSALMVDYSCAIKLSTPICVISAMREATNYDIMIKGGRFWRIMRLRIRWCSIKRERLRFHVRTLQR